MARWRKSIPRSAVACPPLSEERATVLRAAYEDVLRENLRLRDARASITRQLGPLPISAAVVAGLVAGLPGKALNGNAQIVLLSISAALFLAMVLISSLAIRRHPYRTLRIERERERSESPSSIVRSVMEERASTGGGSVHKGQVDWYRAAIKLELEVRYGPGKTEPPHRTNARNGQARPASLEGGFESERNALLTVQTLFFLVVLLLLLARLI
jgi:hypothetical protein